MVFCKECKQKVEECPHFVDPIRAPKLAVHDEKIEFLAYCEEQRVLEITYKTGQVWQLFSVPASIYSEIRDTSLWSFVKFIAQRYRSAPVKTGLKAIKVPDSEKCLECRADMKVRHRIDNQFDVKVRIFWECPGCARTIWKEYGNVVVRAQKGKQIDR